MIFETPEEQEAWVRNWLKEAGLTLESERLNLVSTAAGSLRNILRFYYKGFRQDTDNSSEDVDRTTLLPLLRVERSRARLVPG